MEHLAVFDLEAVPQPQEPEAFGFSILNPDSWSDSTKSTVAPLRYGALAESTTTVTPWYS